MSVPLRRALRACRQRHELAEGGGPDSGNGRRRHRAWPRPARWEEGICRDGRVYRLLKTEARKKFDAGVSAGKAAAKIRLGKFDNWIGTERILLNTFRLYCEIDGTLAPTLDIARMTKAADEFNAIQKATGSRSKQQLMDGLDSAVLAAEMRATELYRAA